MFSSSGCCSKWRLIVNTFSKTASIGFRLNPVQQRPPQPNRPKTACLKIGRGAPKWLALAPVMFPLNPKQDIIPLDPQNGTPFWFFFFEGWPFPPTWNQSMSHVPQLVSFGPSQRPGPSAAVLCASRRPLGFGSPCFAHGSRLFVGPRGLGTGPRAWDVHEATVRLRRRQQGFRLHAF